MPEKITLDSLPMVAIIFGISILIIAAFALSNGSISDTYGQNRCYNSSYMYVAATDTCINATATLVTSSVGTDNLNLSNAYYAMRTAANGNTSIATQMPTLAVILVMTVIIGLIAGLYGYYRKQ